ncbi:MAG: hypothetical protein Q9M18_02310 [Mariprofundaceae bacterium]|nr:hypothetical protein [Mariprofundaceae bacterium]
MLSKITDMIQPRHIGLLGICIIAFLYMALFRYDNYGIEEGAARALLINWSIIHQIANATPLFGVPDLRALMFIFLDLHWAGSLPAAKVFTLFMLLATALMFYRWSENYDNSETAMMGTAMLLISPIAVMQVDSISPGVFLFFCFTSAFWFNEIYDNSKRTVTGALFMLMVMSAFAISLHPMGLALPLALFIQWFAKKGDDIARVKRRNLLIAVTLSTVVLLLMRWGWSGLEWRTDYLASLGSILTGSPILQPQPPTGLGLMVASVLALVVSVYVYQRNYELFSLSLVLACLIGLVLPDSSWALMALITIIAIGLPQLIAIHRRTGIQNLMGQRGGVLLLLMICASMFTSADKHYREVSQLHIKSDVDYLITVAVGIANDDSQAFTMASQWPARTMLATKRDVLPLPPESILQNPKVFLEKTKGVTHFLFNPNAPENKALSRMSMNLGHRMETIELLPAGIILQVNNQ